MNEADHLRQELRRLVAGFRVQLQWRAEHGEGFVAAAASPRLGAVDPSEPPVEEVTPEPAQSAATPAAEPVPESGEAVAAGDQALASAEDLAPAQRLEQVRQVLGDCQRCPLAGGRRSIVFGAGDPEAELMLVGEAPGSEEDRQGVPFVGAAGRLLTRMLKAMGLERDEVYICNIVKCRPPRNRDPLPEEVAACQPFLRGQIAAVQPKLILSMGRVAAQTLLETGAGITRLRGQWASYLGRPLMPTFHPAYLLRNPEAKRPAWSDLQQVMAEMDRLGLRRRR